MSGASRGRPFAAKPGVAGGSAIPIVDVFAGPGGLGEGFCDYVNGHGRRPFRIVLSVEKDVVAHETLRLRSFCRQFEKGAAKGLLSSKLNGDALIERIRADICDPADAIERNGRTRRRGRKQRYTLCALASAKPCNEPTPEDFVIRCEEFEIPQARHRVILVGVREDLEDMAIAFSGRAA